MPSIGASEIILILLIAFIVVGPKDLPKIARMLARAVKRVRLIIQEVKKETGVDEIESEVQDMRREVQRTVKAVDIRSDLKQAKKDIEKTFKDTEKELTAEIKDTKKEISNIGKDLEKDVRDTAAEINKITEE